MGFWNFNFRWHPRIGRHLRGNVTRKGWRSTSAVWGWLSLNFTRRGLRRITIDTPGPGSFSHRPTHRVRSCTQLRVADPTRHQRVMRADDHSGGGGRPRLLHRPGGPVRPRGQVGSDG